MLDYKLIEALALVCQEAGFERAARVLLITQSAVSQRVRQLEDRLGTPLIVRESPPRPTAAGAHLIAHYRRVSQLERDLEDDLRLAPEGEFLTLAVGVNEDSMAGWFMDAVADLARERHFILDVSVDDQDETHKLLRQGEVLGCVSTRVEPLQGCAVTYLGRVDYRCVANPTFAARWFPEGLDTETVARAPAVLYSPKDRIHSKFLEQELGVAHDAFPHHFIPSTHGFLDAIALGLGYGMAQEPQARDLVDGGRGVDLRPGASLPVHLQWHYWDLATGPLRDLTAALVSYARSHFPQGKEGQGDRTYGRAIRKS